ncbi:MAG TPA: PEP-CTERM sorting domain-containing protein [Verrucomicrobiae bacterium]|jgi:hypothetical protein
MKRSIFIAVLGMASAVVAYGQGKVNFSNYYSSTQPTGITFASGPAAGEGVGPQISVELLYGDSTDTTISQLTALASTITAAGIGVASNPGAIGTGAGWFSGGAFVVPSIGAATAGGTYMFALEAFGTYNSVSYVGFSPIFSGTTAASSASPTPNLPNGLYQGSFTVAPVPEPTTLALAGLGGAALLALRRKKA